MTHRWRPQSAGISGGRISLGEATADHMRTAYETSVFGPIRVPSAFIPLLEKSPAPVDLLLARPAWSDPRRLVRLLGIDRRPRCIEQTGGAISLVELE
jgi:hypothetical protein